MARVPIFKTYESVLALIDDTMYRGTIESTSDDGDSYSYMVFIQQVFGPVHL